MAALSRRQPPAPDAGADLLVVGLGNPGRTYEGTRHNVGADVVRLVAQRHGIRLRGEKRIPAEAGEGIVGVRRLALAVPGTYMNDSGQAVAPLCRRFGIEDLDHLLVVHDELDLEPGRLKLKSGGGLAGHNGLRSIRDHLHTTDFARLRVGVGKPPSAARGADHVLRRPARQEAAALSVAVEEAADAVEAVLTNGLEAAMAVVNQAR